MGIPFRALVQLVIFIIVAISLGLGMIVSACRLSTADDKIEKKNLQFYVNQALTQSFDELQMDAPKKQLFETEVLSEGMVFVTSYNATNEGVDVQVDHQKLKNYLRFHAGLFSSTRPVVCLSTKADVECPSCEKLESRFAQSLLLRLEKRGFEVKREGKTVDASVKGEKAFEYALARSAEARCDGTLYAEIFSEEDTNEEGAEKVQVNAYLLLKDKMGRKVKSRGQVLLALSGSEERQVQSLVAKESAELFAGVAAQTSGNSAHASNAGEEKFLRLDNLNNFQTYTKFKQIVANGAPELKLEERFIRPGQIQFALTQGESLQKVAEQLKSLGWATNGLRLQIVELTANELGVVVRGESP